MEVQEYKEYVFLWGKIIFYLYICYKYSKVFILAIKRVLGHNIADSTKKTSVDVTVAMIWVLFYFSITFHPCKLCFWALWDLF